MTASDYDNILLYPIGVSNVAHRGDVDLSCEFLGGLNPIISSPMKGISGPDLVIEMGKLNCLGILHRFDTYEKRMQNIDKISKANVPFGVAIGVNDFDEEMMIANYAFFSGANHILVDIASGYLPQLEEVGERLQDTFRGMVKLGAGNVVSWAGAARLKSFGFDWIRCGIGSGGNCTTRTATGVGRNQLNALQDCSRIDTFLVSDGGIDEAGKAVKSFYFGADAVMLGGVLGHSLEAENDGQIWGMASRKNHILNNKEIKSIEGKETKIDNATKRPLKEIIDEFTWSIKSCCTYGNCSHYSEISSNFNWEYNVVKDIYDE